MPSPQSDTGLELQHSPPQLAIDDPADALMVDRAIADLRFGRAVLVEARDEAKLVAAAETCSAEALRDMRQLGGSGAPRVIVTAERAVALGLAAAGGQDVALALSGDLGLNAVRQLASGSPADTGLAPPKTASLCDAAAIQLTKAARLLPAAVTLASTADTSPLIASGRLLTVTAEAITAYRRDTARALRRISDAQIPLRDATKAHFIVFRAPASGVEHVAVVVGDTDPARRVLVRLHSACLTGDIFGSLRCDCGDQLAESIAALADEGGGVLLYLAQEGRGIGLANKLRAYKLQNEGLDTLEANTQLGFRPDERSYEEAAEMLRQLGIERIVLMTNNPGKIAALTRAGIAVEGRQGLSAAINPHNERYMTVRAERAGHWLD